MRDLRDAMADLAFRLRGAVRLSPPAWKIPAGTFTRLVEGLPAPARGRTEALLAAYDLGRWPRLLTAEELRENLYVLDVLDQQVGRHRGGRGLDVGSKNGVTLPALHALSPGRWDLVEIDAHRRYLDLTTRRVHGQKMAASFPGCRYVAGSVTTLDGPYDLVTWFLPFVRERPLRAWGLPLRLFEPSRLFAHVVSLVRPGGALFVVNQGEPERDAQRALFEAAGLSFEDRGQLASALSPFVRPRYAFFWCRPEG